MLLDSKYSWNFLYLKLYHCAMIKIIKCFKHLLYILWQTIAKLINSHFREEKYFHLKCYAPINVKPAGGEAGHRAGI